MKNMNRWAFGALIAFAVASSSVMAAGGANPPGVNAKPGASAIDPDKLPPKMLKRKCGLYNGFHIVDYFKHNTEIPQGTAAIYAKFGLSNADVFPCTGSCSRDLIAEKSKDVPMDLRISCPPESSGGGRGKPGAKR